MLERTFAYVQGLWRCQTRETPKSLISILKFFARPLGGGGAAPLVYATGDTPDSARFNTLIPRSLIELLTRYTTADIMLEINSMSAVVV